MKIVLVLPTYNERENLGPLLEALQEQFRSIPHDMHVLVVDDSSPDGTAEIALQARRRWGNVHLLSGEKRGLGDAYVRGFGHALHELGADAVMEMDADFSHNPADVPRLVAGLDEGADFVIGSRYIRGGRTLAEWGPFRTGISWLANVSARFVAGLYGVHDCTNGFRVIRGSLLRRIDLGDAPPRGYAIQIYLIYQAASLGARFTEIPVTFSDRVRGESKLRIRDATEFFINAWWIRYDRREKFLRLAAGGLSGIVANIAALAVLRELAGLPAPAAATLGVEASVLYAFAWRSFWLMAAGRRSSSTVGSRLVRFHLASAPSSLLTLVTFAICWGLLGVHYLAAQALGIVPALAWNYFVGEGLLSRVWSEVAQRARGLASLAAGPPPADRS
jgi:dolichol-phosphate mannosyltransferase